MDSIHKINAAANFIRSHLKEMDFGQYQGEAEFQPAGILQYVENLKRGHNTEIGPKDLFEIAYKYNDIKSARRLLS